MRILVPLGTRPEIVKLAPIVHAMRAAGIDVTTLATGQHYDEQMAGSFFDSLGMQPDIRWSLSGEESVRVGVVLTHAYQVVAELRPDVVMVLGDTYTVPLFAIAARRHQVPLVHVEAGLRSFNETSMEEVDRKLAAAVASLHLAPTELAAGFLRAEGVPAERIHVVGNSVIDVLARKGRARVPSRNRSGIVLTAHRATNVDDPARLRMLVDLVLRLADLEPVTFPVHPRTRTRLEAAGFIGILSANPSVQLLPPIPYEAMLDLLSSSRVAVTDSGGVQEEASFFGVPTVVLRASTPRWEGVLAGTAVLSGLDSDRAVEAVRRFLDPDEQARVAAEPCLYGDGTTSERIAAILTDPATARLLRLDEPSFAVERPA